MTEPIVIEPVTMRDGGDCALCCLSMLLGVPYAEVYAAVPLRVRRTVKNDGLMTKQIIAVAKRLGHRLRSIPLDEDAVGLLDLSRPADGHAVIYSKGTVYNPADGLLFTDLEAFLQQGGWTIDGLLVRVTEGGQ